MKFTFKTGSVLSLSAFGLAAWANLPATAQEFDAAEDKVRIEETIIVTSTAAAAEAQARASATPGGTDVITHEEYADRFMTLGVAFHEGALFGWLNQVAGVIAALGVILLSATGGIMWWRRRPKGRLGKPPMPDDERLALGVVVLIVVLGAFLPMACLTLLAALVVDVLISAGKRFGARKA